MSSITVKRLIIGDLSKYVAVIIVCFYVLFMTKLHDVYSLASGIWWPRMPDFLHFSDLLNRLELLGPVFLFFKVTTGHLTLRISGYPSSFHKPNNQVQFGNMKSSPTHKVVSWYATSPSPPR